MPWLHWLRYPLKRRRGGPSLAGLDGLVKKISCASVGTESMFRGGSVLSLVTNPIYCTMLIKTAMGTWYYSVTLFMQGNARDW
jgi:hypothetical protein